MRKFAVAALALAMLAGCSSQPSKPAAVVKKEETKPEAKAPDYETGRTAFQRMYVSAHLWAPDARPYRLQSQYTKDAPKDGRAAIWHAAFASAARRSIKGFVWSGASGEDAPARGVSSGTEDTYNPSNTSTQVFDSSFLKIDSDKALAVAQEHGGEKLMKKSPETPVVFALDWN
jgi:hypothetical protein